MHVLGNRNISIFTHQNKIYHNIVVHLAIPPPVLLSTMVSIKDIVATLPAEDNAWGWGPPPSTEKTLDGVPYAPFSKTDKLGHMADWTSDNKDRDGRPRGQYRGYRGMLHPLCVVCMVCV